jgi:hypothetical protein
MANEWKLVRETSVPIPFTCANATPIPKGTAVKIVDPNTVEATGADGDAFIGVTAEEKIANDGNTKIGVYTSGEFIVKDSGAGVAVGAILKMNGANLVATSDEAGAQCAKEYVGISLEAAAASNTFLALIGRP